MNLGRNLKLGAALLTIPMFIGISSCSFFSSSDKSETLDDDPGTPLSSADTGGGTLSGLSGVTPRVRTELLPNEEDIVWADEDPNKPMALDEVWSKEAKSDWHVSYKEAMRVARKTGKPVLVWFTNSASSPTCKHLSSELFSTPQYKEWADEHFVQLRVDSNVQDSDDGRRARKRDYVEELKKRYKVIGAPVVIILSPRGTSFGKYRGYKSGDPEFYFGRLKSALRNVEGDIAIWREEQEKNGYRMWHDLRGRSLFAKLLRYSKGNLLLVEPDGVKSKLHESKLSPEDRNWIAEEKAKRNR